MLLSCGVGSPLDCKEIKPVNPKGNKPWIFIRKTDTEAEAPMLCSPDAKSQLIRKDPDVGKDWRQERKGTTEEEMVGWHHWLNGHEFEQALGDGEGQGSLVCYSPWGCKESDTTEQLNWFNEYSKVVGYTQISLAFLYTNNWKTEKLRQADSILLSHQGSR